FGQSLSPCPSRSAWGRSLHLTRLRTVALALRFALGVGTLASLNEASDSRSCLAFRAHVVRLGFYMPDSASIASSRNNSAEHRPMQRSTSLRSRQLTSRA